MRRGDRWLDDRWDEDAGTSAYARPWRRHEDDWDVGHERDEAWFEGEYGRRLQEEGPYGHVGPPGGYGVGGHVPHPYERAEFSGALRQRPDAPSRARRHTRRESLDHAADRVAGVNVVFEGAGSYGTSAGTPAGTIWPPPYPRGARRWRQRARPLARGPKNYRRSDRRILEDVCEALMMPPDLDPSEVEVRVENGEVTLTGTVPERWMKRAIEDVCEDQPGVEDVHNRIRVASGATASEAGRTVL